MSEKIKSDIMTLDEVRKYLKVHRSTVYRLAEEGKIPASKVGRVWRFKKESIDGWLKKQENSSLG
jgi:excisionase family DNA binding protein